MIKFFKIIWRTFLITVLLYNVSQNPLQAQITCDNTIKLKDVVATAHDSETGKIHIDVTTLGAFEAKLFQVSGSGKVLFSQKTGQLSQEIQFNDLPGDENFQVLVIFTDEKEAWCKRRQISEIKTLAQ
jgi:hypothetical protein